MIRLASSTAPFLLLFAVALFASAAASAQAIDIEASAVSFSEVDGERIATFLDFSATSRDFTLASPSGRYNEATEVMVASGSGGVRASLARKGENAFDVLADEISIRFDDETLAAAGDVTFRSGDLDARSDELIVDRLAALEARIAALLDAVSHAETAQLIQEFLSKVGPEDRLILLAGNVRLVRDDSTMESAWMLVNEADQSEMISVAGPDRRLRLTISSEESEGGSSQE